MSISQLCELLAIEPDRFLGIETNRHTKTVQIVLEPEEINEPNERHHPAA